MLAEWCKNRSETGSARISFLPGTDHDLPFLGVWNFLVFFSHQANPCCFMGFQPFFALHLSGFGRGRKLLGV